jgi:hypothetical protein
MLRFARQVHSRVLVGADGDPEGFINTGILFADTEAIQDANLTTLMTESQICARTDKLGLYGIHANTTTKRCIKVAKCTSTYSIQCICKQVKGLLCK